MVIRTYFDKNNTIIKDSLINTGKNEIAELYYGTNDAGQQVYSRFLFYFDLARIIEFFGDLPKTNVKHTLKMTNTGVFHNDLLNRTTGDGKRRTSSFDLRLVRIEEDWDEGTGYDYESGNETMTSKDPSNYRYATTNTEWTKNPIESASLITSTAKTISQSFDSGDENIEMDITDVINDYLANPSTNYGLAIAIEYDLENLEVDGLEYVGFFTRHTNTFYQPYVESKTINPIKDDREKFYMGKENKLYLYVTKNGVPSDIDELLTVDIEDSSGNAVLSSLPTSKERKGVYSVSFEIPQNDDLENQLYYDVWKTTTSTITEMQFPLLSNNQYFNAGSYDTIPENYKVEIRGVRNNEIIKRGDIRKVYVNALIPYTVNNKVSVDKAEYRLYVKEGTQEHTVIDFEPVDVAFNSNYFLLDTASLLPNTYYLDIKLYSNMEVRSTPEIISFEIKA